MKKPKFKVGDRVDFIGTSYGGKIVEVKTFYLIELNTKSKRRYGYDMIPDVGENLVRRER